MGIGVKNCGGTYQRGHQLRGPRQHLHEWSGGPTPVGMTSPELACQPVTHHRSDPASCIFFFFGPLSAITTPHRLCSFRRGRCSLNAHVLFSCDVLSVQGASLSWRLRIYVHSMGRALLQRGGLRLPLWLVPSDAQPLGGAAAGHE
jgi:hypothetical protein